MKIVFFGSDDFAAAHLEALLNAKLDVIACVCPPDKVKDRGQKLKESEIKLCAQDHNIALLQPYTLKDDQIVSELKNLDADLFVVIAYGQILSQEVLDIPKVCSVNVHGSHLPHYRGAAPINWAIVNGEEKTGISIIRMNAALDAGDIIVQEQLDIKEADTAVTLRERMMKQGPALLLDAIDQLEHNSVKFKVQDHDVSSYAPKLTKALGSIDWNKTAKEINNQVRGFLPWPSAYTYYKEKYLKILSSEVKGENGSSLKPGEVTDVSKEGIFVMTAEGVLLMTQVHYQDSKPMGAHAFSLGHKIEIGHQF